jgi:predicted nicotinamide N-methyase
VLELAAGLGLPGQVAAHVAAAVVISDYMPQAVEMAASSVAVNGLTNVRCRVLDWNALPDDLEADVLLLSDINYEPSAFERLHSVLLDFLGRGSTILLATPQRLMAKSFIARLIPYCFAQGEQQVSLNGESAFISVFALRQNLENSPHF